MLRLNEKYAEHRFDFEFGTFCTHEKLNVIIDNSETRNYLGFFVRIIRAIGYSIH